MGEAITRKGTHTTRKLHRNTVIGAAIAIGLQLTRYEYFVRYRAVRRMTHA